MESHSFEPVVPRPSAPPPGAWAPLTRLVQVARRPLERFLRIEAASGILLLVVAAVAMLWSNSPWASSYFGLWHTAVGIRIGGFAFERSLEWVVNDVLMVVFFFVVGLEIRREVHHGELSEWRRAALPFAAALGGMVAPALIYLALAGAKETHSGWGVPMATDIAFALGVLTLLGKRVPPALRVLLLALAVIDDVGAIIVIAAFYSSGVNWIGLLVAAAGVAGILILQAFGIRKKPAYVVPGVVVWAGTYASGIHPTIAGVVVGMLTPVHVWLGAGGFVEHARIHIESLSSRPLETIPAHDLDRALRSIQSAGSEAMSPAESLIERLHPWVAFVIMPIFALANAGVQLSGLSLEGASAMVVLGVGAGLVIGKPLGVLLACHLTLRLRIAALPLGLSQKHLVVLGLVAGIGFTMALFVAQLAFADARLLSAAKLGILVASGVAAVAGVLLGRIMLTHVEVAGAAGSADEAECSTVA